jgi:hypothetical protein
MIRSVERRMHQNTHDMEPATPPPTPSARDAALTDRFGLVVPAALPLLDALEVLLLRLLGRLDLMTLQQIQQVVFPTYSVRGVRYRLQELLNQDLLWRVQTRTVAANHAALHTKVKRQGAYAFGLATNGKALLETLEVERDPHTVERLRARDIKGRKPDLRTISHDLQVSWWCLNLILTAAYNRLCRQIYVQTEFYPERSQRMDALIILRLSPDHPRPADAMGSIPFFDGTPRGAHEIDIRLALEVDKGTEELKVLLEKAEKYRDLHASGIYTATLGGPVLPVFVVQTPRRAAQIAREFQAIWPSGWGVVGTPFSANSADGVLWGKYKTLTTSQPFDVLTHLVVDQGGRVQFFPAVSREAWQRALVAPTQATRNANQEHGRRGGLERAARAAARRTTSAGGSG